MGFAAWAPLSHAFCKYNIARGEPLVIEDARQHPLVCDSLAIRDLGVVAYLGIPLITAEGHALGSFCVIDPRPRRWTEQEIEILSDLAASVMTEIELRALAQEAKRERHERQALLDASTDGIFGLDARGTCTFINPAAQELLGYRADECLGKNMHELTHYRHGDGPTYSGDDCPITEVLRTEQAVRLDCEVLWRRGGDAFPVEYSCSPIVEHGLIKGAVVTFTDSTQRKRAEGLLAEQAKLMALRAEVGLALAASGDLRSVLQGCTEALIRHLDAAFARIWTLDEDEHVLELQASAGLYTHLDGAHSRVPLGRYKIGLIAQERRPHLTNAVIGDPRVSDQDWARREGMVSFAGYPLIIEDRLVGVMALFARHPLGESSLEAMGSVADHVALGIERKRAEDERARLFVHEQAARIARVADVSGLDLVGIQDHPYNGSFFDTWTLLATLVPRTRSVRFLPDVANLPLRPPAMLAKAAATLDVLSGGRLELGLGAGAFWEGIRAMGGPARSPGEAVGGLEEAIRVLRLLWSGQRGARFAGQHYSLHGAQAGPQPAHPIGIWLGALGPRMLALTGRLADGVIWSTSYVPPDRLAALHARIDEAAEAAGRSPKDVRRVYNLMGSIQPARGDQPLIGPVSQWVDELTRYAIDHGMDTFIYWPLEDHVRQLELFANEVVPAVRAAVAREPGAERRP